MGISAEPYLVKSWKELEQSFESGKVDVIPHHTQLDRLGYHKIYEMTGDQVFIVTSNEQKSLLYQLDDALATLYTRKIIQSNTSMLDILVKPKRLTLRCYEV